MVKRITSLIIAMIMIISVAGVKTTSVHAATTPFMTVVCDGPIKEKVGNYYIWVKECPEEDAYSSDYELRCSKQSTGKGTLIKTVTGGEVITNVISNGQTIYYGVYDKNDEQMVIYKTSVTGGSGKKFRTVKDVKGACGPITVFNNRLYYDIAVTDINGKNTWNIYSVNLNNKANRLEKSGFKGQSGYGRYMTCDNELKNIKTQLYNAKTRSSTSLLKSKCSRVYNGNVYYGSWDDMGAYVKKTNLAGKKAELLGQIGAEDLYYQVIYLGKKAAYIKSYQYGNLVKLTYATKKIVPVKNEESTTKEESTQGGPIAPIEGGEYNYIMTVDPVPDVLWQGKTVYPKIIVRVNGVILKQNQININYYNNGGVGYGYAEVELVPPEITGDMVLQEDLACFNKIRETVKFKILHPNYKTTNGPVRDISKVSNYYYTGKPVIPEFKVWGTNVYLNKGVLLKEGEDYTVHFTNNIKPGRAQIEVAGITYSGTHYRTFNILKAPVKLTTVSGITDRYYSGKAQVQNKMTVTYNGKTLKKGTHYTVSYKNNTKAGKASVIIKGKGACYTGTVTKTFNIVKGKVGKVSLASVKNISNNTIKVTWKKAANAKKYQVWRATSSKGPYKLIKTTTDTSFANKNLTEGKKYYYKVRAVNGTLKGKFSVVKSAVSTK